jgi:hypothetical protein
MTTKIFVSQIDNTQPDGSTASQNSFIILGSSGPYWYDGALNYTGYRGSAGYFGSAGYHGSVGYTGSAGEDGAPGLSGYRGSAGFRGSVGARGYDGSVGFRGSAGYLGSVGYTGSGGAGYTGSAGYFGSTGYLGSVGYTGSVGFFGSVGYQGSAGDTADLSFLELNDTPDTYNPYGKYVLVVNAAQTGVVFTANLEINSVNSYYGNLISLAVSTITSNTTYTGNNLNMNTNRVYKATLYGHSELVNVVGNSGSTETLSVFDGNIVTMTLNAATVQVQLDSTNLQSGKMYTIALFLKQDGSGSREVDWSLNNIWWPSAEGINQVSGPELSTTANYTDVITLYTLDGGSNWYGVFTAKGFPTT